MRCTAPAIDSTLTYRQAFQSLQRALPAEFDCISSRQVGESFRGMLQYRTGISLIDTEHSGDSAPADCELRLLREGDLDLAPDRDWELLWQGGRSGDYRVFHLFRKRDPPAPAP